MALIQCPECNRPVSSEAPQCIHCGLPTPGRIAETRAFAGHAPSYAGSQTAMWGAPAPSQQAAWVQPPVAVPSVPAGSWTPGAVPPMPSPTWGGPAINGSERSGQGIGGSLTPGERVRELFGAVLIGFMWVGMFMLSVIPWVGICAVLCSAVGAIITLKEDKPYTPSTSVAMRFFKGSETARRYGRYQLVALILPLISASSSTSDFIKDSRQQRADELAAVQAAQLQAQTQAALQVTWAAGSASLLTRLAAAEVQLRTGEVGALESEVQEIANAFQPFRAMEPMPADLSDGVARVEALRSAVTQLLADTRVVETVRLLLNEASTLQGTQDWLGSQAKLDQASQALRGASETRQAQTDMVELARTHAALVAQVAPEVSRLRANQAAAEAAAVQEQQRAAQAAAAAETRRQAEEARNFRLGNFSYRLNSVTFHSQMGPSFSRERASSGATFVVVRFAMRNESNSTQMILTNNLVLIDARGREFDTSSRAEVALAMSDQSDFLLSELQPGIQRNMAAGFEVPLDAVNQPYTIRFQAHGFSARRHDVPLRGELE